MKNLSRLIALMIVFVMMFNTAAFAAEVPVTEFNLADYEQMLSDAIDQSNDDTVYGVGLINSDDVQMYSKQYGELNYGNELLATLEDEAVVTLYDGVYQTENAGDWYKVGYEGKVGYIETEHIDIFDGMLTHDETGITAHGVLPTAKLHAQMLNNSAPMSSGVGFVADIKVEGGWDGDKVEIRVPVASATTFSLRQRSVAPSTIDVVHFIEDADKISAATPVASVSAFEDLRGELGDAIAACYAATGMEDCVAVELMEDLPIEDGFVSFSVDSFSIFAAGEYYTTTYEFYFDGELWSSQILIGSKDGETGKGTLLQPKTPSKSNYEFLGWQQEGAAGFMNFIDGKLEVNVEDDTSIRCNAVLAGPVYNVYFMYTDINGENASVMQTVSVESGGTVEVDAVQYPASQHLIVRGWYKDKDKKEPVTNETVINSDMTLWPDVAEGYWITFDTDGGTPVDPITCAKDEKADKPMPPTKVGYTFAGWYEVKEDGEEGDKEFDFSTQITSNTKLKAHWYPAEVNYTFVAMMQQANDADAYDSIGLSWNGSGKTGEQADLKTMLSNQEAYAAWDKFVLEQAENFVADEENASSDFTTYRDWFYLNKTKTEEQVDAGVTIAADGSTVVYIYFDRREVSFEFHEKETHNVENAVGYVEGTDPVASFTTIGLRWVDTDDNKVLYTLNGRFGQSYDKSSVSGEWQFRGTTDNGQLWPFEPTVFNELPTAYIDWATDPNEKVRCTIKVFKPAGTTDNGLAKWQLFYYVQELTDDKTGVKLDLTEDKEDEYWEDKDNFIQFDQDPKIDPGETEPDVKAEADGWKNISAWTTEWQDSNGNVANTVYFTPHEGFTLGAYARDITLSGLNSNREKFNVRVADTDIHDGNDNTYAWEVATDKNQTSPKTWARLYDIDTSDKWADSVVELGEWKYWPGGDAQKEEGQRFSDGYSLSYLRNRGDMYVRLLRNKYTLTLMGTGQDGSSIASEPVELYYEATLAQDKVQNAVNTMTAPVGYEIEGWYTSMDCKEGTEVTLTGENAMTMPAHNVTLYAKYKKIVETVKVYLTTDGSGESEEISVPYGERISDADMEKISAWAANIANELPEGSEWFGWYTHRQIRDTYVLVPFNFDQQITSDVYLYPYYGSTTPYKVVYKASQGEEDVEGTPPSDDFNYFNGSAAVIKDSNGMALDGKVFLGWKAGDDVSDRVYLPGEIVEITGNLTLAAVWGDAPGTVTLTYHENLKTSEEQNKQGTLENGKVTVLGNMFTSTNTANGYCGHAFVGWNTQKDGLGETFLPGEVIILTAEASNDLYAMWEKIYGDLVITKSVSDENKDADQTFIFDVLDDDEKLVTSVVIQGAGSATVKHLPLGTYTVKEREGWSWRYEADEAAQSATVSASLKDSEGKSFDKIDGTANFDVKDGEVTFSNTRDKNQWLDGCDYKENAFE